MIEAGTGYYAVPSSVKVVVRAEGRVLLGFNGREEWELPGGWPDRGDDSLAATAVREVSEESGISLQEHRLSLVTVELFRPVPDRQVMLVCLTTELPSMVAPVPSHEHGELRWFPTGQLPESLPAVYRRFIVSA
jgi:8-oxo-dGTP diphosphatase